MKGDAMGCTKAALVPTLMHKDPQPSVKQKRRWTILYSTCFKRFIVWWHVPYGFPSFPSFLWCSFQSNMFNQRACPVLHNARKTEIWIGLASRRALQRSILKPKGFHRACWGGERNDQVSTLLYCICIILTCTHSAGTKRGSKSPRAVN